MLKTYYFGISDPGDPHLYAVDDKNVLPPDIVGGSFIDLNGMDVWDALKTWQFAFEDEHIPLNGLVINTQGFLFEMEFCNASQTKCSVPNFAAVESYYRSGLIRQVFLSGNALTLPGEALYALTANPSREPIFGAIFTTLTDGIRNFKLLKDGHFMEVV